MAQFDPTHWIPARLPEPPAPLARLLSLRPQFQRINRHLLWALALALVFHGALLLSGTFKHTYDAYVHIFFADHYVRSWFDPWDYRWYTGFTLTSYPPGSQQSIALLAPFVGLLNGFIIVQTFSILLFVIGVYRFSKIWVSEEAAGYAALLAVFSSSINETVHVFGQLPTMFSIGFLLNALPYVYRWLQKGEWKILLTAWSVNAATTAAHHVTTLFGAVFFVGPVIVSAIVQKFREPLPDEPSQHPARLTHKNFWPVVVRRLRRIIPVTSRAGVYGVGLVAALVLVVLPYWLWSRADPITQVPIPHASRDSYILNPNAGLVFWLVPYGVSLLALPYAFYKGFTTKAWPLALSLAVLVFLGTGGTTPLPKILLGPAFEILTLDRFTFWATVSMLPLVGEFVVSLLHRGLARYLREQFGVFGWRAVQATLLVSYLLFCIFTVNLTQFRKFQPDPIDMQPIVTFLDKDQHARWRYLTLGFGDQMAWLSAQTTATTVDGNYHSARRLPELTSTPVERLEGAKFRGIPGIGSLQQFLAVPEKYNLKYVFSNDQFYDPLLYFSGWHRLQRLENGVVVWERADIPPLPEVLPRKDIPTWQKLMWGIVPMSAIFSALLIMTGPAWWPHLRRLLKFLGVLGLAKRQIAWASARTSVPFWHRIDAQLLKRSALPLTDDSPVTHWQVWADWLKRLPRPKPAPPTAQQVRTVALIVAGVLVVVGTVYTYLQQARTPIAIVEAYYDDLDFRRFAQAYARFDPATRPAYDQYLLELSVNGGLVASYGKLDSVTAHIVATEPDRVEVEATAVWVTALNDYTTVDRLTLVQRSGQWYIQPVSTVPATPPDEFFRRGTVSWFTQGRRTVTTGPTAFGDILDRPELQILSARLVRSPWDTCGLDAKGEVIVATASKPCYRDSVVGELINTDADPADVTVTAILYDDQGNPLTTYNAQSVIVHTIFPKEVTPFRIDFEGVAGSVLNDASTAGDFSPSAYSPVELSSTVKTFEVYAKAVVTGADLYRDVTAQNVHIEAGVDGQPHLVGDLLNTGTTEATIPHVLLTYYDSQNRVAWVDQAYVAEAIRPQRSQPFDVAIRPYASVETLLDKGDLFANILQNEVSYATSWPERIALPASLGYSAVRVSVNYLVGNGP